MVTAEIVRPRVARLSRIFHGALAGILLANLGLQTALTLGWGQALPEGASTNPAIRLLRLYSYFTILSNILVGISALSLARDPGRDGRVWRVLRLNALVGIIITGVVYFLVLRPEISHTGLELLTDVIFHYVAPVGAVIGWAAFGPAPRITRGTVAWSLVIPLLWTAHTLIHGAIGGWYPYPFLQVPELGYGQVALNSVVVALFFLLLAGLLAWRDTRGRRP